MTLAATLGRRLAERALTKTALIGPLLDVGNFGIPSAIGYALGRSSNPKPEEAKRPMSGMGFMFVPGYTGYHLGRKHEARSQHPAGAHGLDIDGIPTAEELERIRPSLNAKDLASFQQAMSGKSAGLLDKLRIKKHPAGSHGLDIDGIPTAEELERIRPSLNAKDLASFQQAMTGKSAAESCSHKQRLSFHKHCPSCGQKRE